MIRTILQQYRDESAFNRDLGDRFERLIRAYLKLDPQYVALFSDVWLWKDWPEREAYGYKAPDTGIDLVAKLREDEGFCAIQCKFYETPIPLGDLGNFFTLSGKGGFTQRLIVATANLSKHAADALENQTIPVEMMTLEDLDASPSTGRSSRSISLTSSASCPRKTRASISVRPWSTSRASRPATAASSSWLAAPARPTRR
jgi:predicted helicase